MSKGLQSCNGKKIQYCFRRLTKTVDQLFQHIVILLLTLNTGNSLVNIQFLKFVADVGIRNKCIDIKINGRLKIIHSLDSLSLLDSLTEHLAVKVIAHRVHMAMLLSSKKISCSTELQILHGDLKAASKIRIFPHGAESLFRCLLKHLILRIHQKRIGSTVRTSYTSAKLIQLRKTISIGIMDDHGIYIGDIQSRLNNGSGNQYIHISVDKIIHHLLQFPLAHLTMGKIHPGFRHQLRYAKSYLRNIINPIVYIINLAATSKFPADSLPDSLLIIFHNIRLDRHTVHRRLFQNTHVTDTNETHMKSSGNRSCSQCQHIHIFFHLLDLFFMSDTETLFLINDQKSQILKFHIFGKNPVSTDHNVHLAFFDPLDGLFLLGRSTEPAEKIHFHRKFLHTLHKGVVMLLGKNGSGHQINDLAAFLNCLKRSSQSNLRLTVTNVTTHKTVHDLGTFHVLLGILDGCQLILCLLIRKHFFKFLLPDRIRATDIALFFLADRIKLHQLFCDIFNRTPDTALGLVPLLSAKFIQLGCFCIFGKSGIFLQSIQLGCQDVEIAATTVLNLDVIFYNSVHFHFFDSTINSKSMFFVDNKIPDGKLRKILDTVSTVLFLLFALLLLFAENVCFRHHRKFDQRILETTARMAINNHDLAGAYDTVCILSVKSIQAFL